MKQSLAATLQRRLRRAGTVLALSGLLANGCGGPQFTAGGSSGSGGEGASSGGSGGEASTTGGKAGGAVAAGGSAGEASTTGGKAGGAVAGGGSAGAVAAGGGSGGAVAAGGSAGRPSSGGARAGGAGGGPGVGGLGLGGLLGTGGGQNAGFPATKLLDDFGRENNDLGSHWRGATDSFTTRDEQLADTTGTGQPLLWETEFGPNQEVFATLASFAADAPEINLILKARQVGNPCDLIEVLYMPNRAQVGVHFCSAAAGWTELEPLRVTLMPGDQLGARVTSSGKIVVYRNGNVLMSFDASAFPYQTGGYIGVNALSSADDAAVWDDFGGGNTTP